MCDRDDKGPWGEFARAAEEFGKSMESMFRGFGCCDEDGAEPGSFHFDFACKPFRPPMKRYRDKAGNLVFEFILPGFDMADIDLGFAGDAMYLSAKKPRAEGAGDASESGFAVNDIEHREYPVKAGEWNQAEAKAVLRHGILRVSIPPMSAPREEGGIKVEIVSA